ncbi:hypothetical protein [Sphingomonas sp. 1P08PE]|uniref:hypothetical protein n=1 Tax=Sphingomonas sp. 1P08PE TaxID=554122 RepID=UPI0039A09AA2
MKNNSIINTHDNDGLISPREAIAKIIHYVGSELEAKQVLADGLRSGKARLVAAYMWETDVGDVQDEWVPRRRKGFDYDEDVEIHSSYFTASMQWPKELLDWRWDNAEFVVYNTPGHDPKLNRCYFKGVRFVEEDVLKLVGRSGRSGGPKSDRERWAMFWINVLWDFTGANYDWTQYETPYELKQALLSANEDAANEPGVRGDKTMFADSNIDFAVELAWKHLVLRSAREAIRADLASVSESH